MFERYSCSYLGEPHFNLLRCCYAWQEMGKEVTEESLVCHSFPLLIGERKTDQSLEERGWELQKKIASVYLPTYLSIYLPIPPVYLSIHVTSIYPSMHLPSTHLSTCLFMYHPSTHQPLPIYLSTIHLTSTRLSVYESISNFLSIHPSTHPFMYHLSTCLSVYPSINPSTYLSIYIPVHLSKHGTFFFKYQLSIHLLVYMPARLPVCLPTYPSISLSVCPYVYQLHTQLTDKVNMYIRIRKYWREKLITEIQLTYSST